MSNKAILAMAILLVGSTIGSIDTTAATSETVFPTPAQLQECRELNIPSYQCSEQKILEHFCTGMNCSPQTNTKFLLNIDMLEKWGILTGVFGGVGIAFFLRTRRKT